MLHYVSVSSKLAESVKVFLLKRINAHTRKKKRMGAETGNQILYIRNRHISRSQSMWFFILYKGLGKINQYCIKTASPDYESRV